MTDNRKRSFFILFLLLALVLLATLPLYATAYYLSSLISIFMYVILTVSWAMFSVPTGYMSLATAAFFGVGIYTTAVLGEMLPLLLVVFSGGVLSFLVAILVGLACLRLRGIYFAIFTFGLTELILHSVLFYELEVTGTVGRLVVGIDQMSVYYAMLAIVIVLLITVHFFRRSKYGLALQSIGEAELAAAHSGVNVNAVKVVTFAFTSFFMGLAGSIMVTQWTYVDSRTAFNIFNSFMPALMAIFGGARLVRGQILGAVVLTILTEALLTEFPYYYMLMFGALIVAVILYSPSGLIGLFESIKKRFRGERVYANP